MGFRDFRDRYREEHQFDCLATGKWRLYGKNLQIEGLNYPVAGAKASYESGAQAAPRLTATRVAAGAVIAGPLGAVIGGLAKKDMSTMFIILELADGEVLTVEARPRDEAKVRRFVKAVNTASEYWTQTA